jgi:hypothetical protein
MTDGNISSKQADANITSVDKDWIESIRDLICPDKPLILDRKYVKLSLTNITIVDWLVSNHCTPNKTFTIQFPKVPPQFLFDFIRGLMDGDGNISFTPNKKVKVTCNLLGASRSFMQSLHVELKNLGFKFSFVTLKGGRERSYKNNSWIEKELYRISFYGTNTYKLLKQIYYPNNPLSLSRKQTLANQIINHYEQTKNNSINRELNIGCKIQWPDNESLIKLVKQEGFMGAGRQLSVSDAAIRNRLKVRGLLEKVRS